MGHPDAPVTFTPPQSGFGELSSLTTIVGANGSGKSSLLNCLKYFLENMPPFAKNERQACLTHAKCEEAWKIYMDRQSFIRVVMELSSAEMKMFHQWRILGLLEHARSTIRTVKSFMPDVIKLYDISLAKLPSEGRGETARWYQAFKDVAVKLGFLLRAADPGFGFGRRGLQHARVSKRNTSDGEEDDSDGQADADDLGADDDSDGSDSDSESVNEEVDRELEAKAGAGSGMSGFAKHQIDLAKKFWSSVRLSWSRMDTYEHFRYCSLALETLAHDSGVASYSEPFFEPSPPEWLNSPASSATAQAAAEELKSSSSNSSGSSSSASSSTSSSSSSSSSSSARAQQTSRSASSKPKDLKTLSEIGQAECARFMTALYRYLVDETLPEEPKEDESNTQQNAQVLQFLANAYDDFNFDGRLPQFATHVPDIVAERKQEDAYKLRLIPLGILRQQFTCMHFYSKKARHVPGAAAGSISSAYEHFQTSYHGSGKPIMRQSWVEVNSVATGYRPTSVSIFADRHLESKLARGKDISIDDPVISSNLSLK